MKKAEIKKSNHSRDIQSRKSNNHWLWILALIALTIWVFFPGLHNQLTNWDDNHYINQNKHIAPLNFENLKHYFTTFYIGNYHPFTMLAYAIDYHFFKLDPFPYHVINLIVHIVNSILVIFFIQKLSQNFRISVLCGFLFAVHPLHVESVVWVSERKDVMFMFFYLLGLLNYLRFREEHKTSFLFIAVVAFVFSCLFKAMAVSFPAVLVLLDYLRVGREIERSGKRVQSESEVWDSKKFSFSFWINKLPFIVITLLFGILALMAQKSAAAVNIFSDHTLWDRIIFVSYGLVFYPMKLLAPFNLSPYYPYPDKTAGVLPFHYWMYPLLTILLFSIIFVMYRKNFRLGLFCMFFYLVTILPVIQVVQVGEAIVAERYSYLPSLGIFFIFAYGVEKFADNYKNKFTQKVIFTVFSIYLLGFSLYSRYYCTLWKDSVTLWTVALKQFPTFALGYYNRSNEYIQRGQFDLAIADLDKAINSKPNYAHALNNRGYCLHLLGKNKEAYPDLKRAVEIDPSYSDPLNNLGVVCFQLGKPDSAIFYFKKGLELAPEYGELYKNIGAVYYNMNDFKNAIIYYEKALKFYPDDKNILMYISQLKSLVGG